MPDEIDPAYEMAGENEQLRAEVERLTELNKIHYSNDQANEKRIAELEAEVERLREYERIYNRSKGERIAELESRLEIYRPSIAQLERVEAERNAAIAAVNTTQEMLRAAEAERDALMKENE